MRFLVFRQTEIQEPWQHGVRRRDGIQAPSWNWDYRKWRVGRRAGVTESPFQGRFCPPRCVGQGSRVLRWQPRTGLSADRSQSWRVSGVAEGSGKGDLARDSTSLTHGVPVVVISWQVTGYAVPWSARLPCQPSHARHAAAPVQRWAARQRHEPWPRRAAPPSSLSATKGLCDVKYRN